MTIHKVLIFLLLVCLSPGVLAGAAISASRGQSDFFYGGSIGASFGEVDYVDVAPMVGKHLSDQLAVGMSLLYRHRNDSRSGTSISTDDFGGSLFARYQMGPMFFLQTDYEYLDHEFAYSDGSTARKSFDSLLAGGGIRSSLGGNVSSYMIVQYNLTYDEDEDPYGDPVSVRFGVGVGF